jgi:hypothetical protein
MGAAIGLAAYRPGLRLGLMLRRRNTTQVSECFPVIYLKNNTYLYNKRARTAALFRARKGSN